MNKSLASGHENRQETPATAMPDASSDPLITFSDVPLLVEIEAWIARERGVTWRAEFEARVAEVSVALFGVKHLPKPQRGNFNSEGGYYAADSEWTAWQAAIFRDAEVVDGEIDVADYLIDLGIDIWDADGNELRCAEWFMEQAIAAVLGVAGAKLTLDGSGKRAGQSMETWGASLSAEAAKFAARPRRP